MGSSSSAPRPSASPTTRAVSSSRAVDSADNSAVMLIGLL